MNHLPEILRVVAQLRDPKLEVINEDYDKDSPENISKLYYGFKSGDFSNDQAASSTIYNAPPTDSRYTTLKTRLKKRLLNSLFLLDLKRKGYSDYAQALYKSNKRVFIVKTLMTLGARNTAIRLAETDLIECQKYHLTYNAIELLRHLRYHQTVMGTPKDFEHYDSLLNSTFATLGAELRAAGLFESLRLKFAKRAQIGEDQAKLTREYASELEVMKEKCDSFAFMMAYFRVQELANSSNMDFRATIRTSNDAIAYLDSHPSLAYPLRYAEFELAKLSSYRNLREFDEGFKVALRCGELFPTGTNSWFYYNEDYFLLTMCTLHIQEAEKIFKQISEHKRFDQLPDIRKERWKIFELYLRYAMLRNPEGTEAERTLPRMKTFLRSVPMYSNDKQGFNVAVLILQILFLLELEEFNEIISRMEALRTYRGRYLKSNSNRQSSLFFKLLQVMENNSFSYKLTKEKSKKYEESLTAATSDTDINEGLQILPFDWLWQQILAKLNEVEIRQSSELTVN